MYKFITEVDDEFPRLIGYNKYNKIMESLSYSKLMRVIDILKEERGSDVNKTLFMAVQLLTFVRGKRQLLQTGHIDIQPNVKEIVYSCHHDYLLPLYYIRATTRL